MSFALNSPAATAEPHAYANSVRRVHPSIEPMFERLGGLCSLPAIAEKVIQVAEDELSDATDLLTVIEQDAAVATRLMQVVNSSYCGLRNPVGDLKTAVTMLGQDRVRNLALTVSIGGQFQRATPLGQLDPARLWDHSVCVATIARIAASRSNACNPDEAYLAGLLHDLGLLFITQQLAPLVPRVLARLATGSSLCDAEREVMAFDHAQLGAYVAWRAGFPDHQVAAIDYHHTTYEASPAAQPLTQTVAVANYLATRYGRGAIEGRRLPAPGEGMLRTLGFTLPQLRDLWDDLPDTVAEVAALTGI